MHPSAVSSDNLSIGSEAKGAAKRGAGQRGIRGTTLHTSGPGVTDSIYGERPNRRHTTVE